MKRRNLLKSFVATLIPGFLRGQRQIDPTTKKRAEKWLCDFDALVNEAKSINIQPEAEMLIIMRRSMTFGGGLDTTLLASMKLWQDQALKTVRDIPDVSAADIEALQKALNEDQSFGCPFTHNKKK